MKWLVFKAASMYERGGRETSEPHLHALAVLLLTLGYGIWAVLTEQHLYTALGVLLTGLCATVFLNLIGRELNRRRGRDMKKRDQS